MQLQMDSLVFYFSTVSSILTLFIYVTSQAPIGFWCKCTNRKCMQQVVKWTGLSYHAKDCKLYHVLGNKERSQNFKQRLEQTCTLETFFELQEAEKSTQ